MTEVNHYDMALVRDFEECGYTPMSLPELLELIEIKKQLHQGE